MCGSGLGLACCVVFACCCVVPLVTIGSGLWFLGPLVQELGAVAQCVNKTLALERNDFAQQMKGLADSSSCVEAGRLHCEKNTEQTTKCHKLMVECGCKFAEYFSKQNPEDKLKKCCVEVEKAADKIEKKLHGLDIADIVNEATHKNLTIKQQCFDTVDNVTGEIEKFADACAKGDPESYHLPAELEVMINAHSNTNVPQDKPQEKFLRASELASKLSGMQSSGFVAALLCSMMALACVGMALRRQSGMFPPEFSQHECSREIFLVLEEPDRSISLGDAVE